MIKIFYKKEKGFINILDSLDREHPYFVSGAISLIFVSFLLFYTPSVGISDEDLMPTENIRFISIEEIKAPKRIVKKQISTEEGEITDDASNAERAVGISDDSNAVDIAFHPNIAPPKLIGKLSKKFPIIAKENNVEAIVNLELLITANGKVKDVKVLGIRLFKSLPDELHEKISRAFLIESRKKLMGKKFSPPIVNGKNVPIRMEFPLRFQLN